MSDIFREVEEDIRREQAKALWNRYGAYVIAVAVLIVAVTAGWRGWQWYEARQAAQGGQQYYEAMQFARDGQYAEADAAFTEIARDNTGFSVLARLRSAATLADAGNVTEAVAAFDAVSNDGSVEGRLRDVARVRAAYLLLGEGDLAGVNQRVGSMAVEGNPWRHSAREILGLAAYQAGDLSTANARFEELMADSATPQDMRQRAQLMVALIAADGPPAAAPASEAPASDAPVAEPVASEEADTQ